MTNQVNVENGRLVVIDENGQEITAVKTIDLPDSVRQDAIVWALTRILRESQNPAAVVERWTTEGKLLGMAGRPADLPSVDELREALGLLKVAKAKVDALATKWANMSAQQKKEVIKTNKALKRALDAIRLQADSQDFDF